MSYSGGSADYSLASLEIKENGEVKVPETRMRNAANVQDLCRRLWQNDQKRSLKRAKVNGLCAGFPPYQRAKLVAAGRAEACNANFNTASAYMESGAGAFYDLYAEAPGMIGIRTSHGTEEEREASSRAMSEGADRILFKDPLWDYEMQRSQWELVLHGCGPFMFEDGMRVLPRAISCGDFKVPERTRSDINYFELFSCDVDYYPPQLYEFIKNEAAATSAGWNVKYTQNVIANAMDIRQPENRPYDWEFYQQEIKNNSLSYYDDSKVCHLAFVFWKEFDGRITQVIVERESTTTSGEIQYLFQDVGRYKDFTQCAHPMYFDRGNGGYHHSVTGFGTKAYSALEFENRLLCRLMDGAFAPKVLFRPTSAEATQKMQLSHLGNFGVLSPGWDALQTPMQGFLEEGLAMFRASSDLMRSNLSSYRQGAPMKQEGNPPTARQVMHDASQQSSLSKTTFNRYYKQLDALYTEIVRRLCNLNSTDQRAKEFQEWCENRGVPRECFGRIESVEAIRVVGEGSAFLRKQSLTEMQLVVPGLPEDGKQKWTDDYISATCGQRAVARYNPHKTASKLPSDQQFNALEGVTMMKVGVAPLVTSSQNALTFAATYLQAGVQALQSVQKGGDPFEVLKFLQLCGPAIVAHVKRIVKDPIRAQAAKVIIQQWKQLARATDMLKKQVQQMQQKRQQQAGKTQQVLNDLQLRNLEAKSDIAIKQQKAKVALQTQLAKTKQKLAIDDATAAGEIHRNNMRAFHE